MTFWRGAQRPHASPDPGAHTEPIRTFLGGLLRIYPGTLFHRLDVNAASDQINPKDMKLRYIVMLVVLVWATTPFAVSYFLPELQERGQFGDLFGSVNALFSGLAFAGLFWSLSFQQKQLAAQQEQLVIQREELKLQREEMVASRKELQSQVAAQEALARAAMAHIAVAGTQAEIEALKIEAAEKNPGGRIDQIAAIRKHANALNSLSDKLEGQLRR